MHVTVWFDYFELCMPDLFSVLVQYQTVLLAVKQIHEVVPSELVCPREQYLDQMIRHTHQDSNRIYIYA